MSMVSRTALTLLAGLIAVPFTPVNRTATNNAPEQQAAPAAYAATAKEAYLAPEALTYIRPGLNIKIQAVTNFGPGQKPVVEFYITDDLKGPLDRAGLATPGAVSVRWVPAVWDATKKRYTDYLSGANGLPTRDNGTTGTWQELEVGHYKYTFGNAFALPATMDPTKPHTLFMGGVRNTTDIVGKNYYAVPQYLDFVPSTNVAATTFNAMTVARCNQCHDPLALHGGNYRDIKTCVMCHNPNNMTGANVGFDGQIFFHAIHQGSDATIGPITYPQDLRFCTTCHDPKAAGGDSWYTNASIASCGSSCHKDLNFTTGANHAAGPASDGSCTTCHKPQDDQEYGPGIKTAHVVPLKSAQLKGLKASIVSVTNAAPGQKPVVSFKLQNGDGSFVDPGNYKVSSYGTLNIIMGGPTTDYTNVGEAAAGQPFREAAQNATYNATTGIGTYTFTNAIPAAAKGTYTFSIETRRANVLNPAPAKGPTTINEGAPNVPFNVAVTGTTVVPRRTSVSLTKCNACHADLYALFSHGNQRIAIEHCVICHNPNGSDIGRRPADGSKNPGESVSFARMIHRIHTGEELQQDYTIYGFGGNPANFNEVTYPGDRRNCLACHVDAAAYALPLPITNVPVVTDRDFFSPRGSATNACTGCHDSRDVAAHAYINTAYFPNSPAVPAEACGTCHATGATYGVDKVHAR
ncbi:MAG TPA: OmcA/MtrC family decaheme c-type cytochrome [Thermoanaerobaculia bacterium]|jgi:OmcA/MtrC family decaheme c-type cytochrome